MLKYMRPNYLTKQLPAVALYLLLSEEPDQSEPGLREDVKLLL